MWKAVRIWMLLGPLLVLGWLGQSYADGPTEESQRDGTVGIIPASPQSAEQPAPDTRGAVAGAVEDARAMTKVVVKPNTGPGNPDKPKPAPKPDSWPWWVPKPEPSMDPPTNPGGPNWPQPKPPTLPGTVGDDQPSLAPTPDLQDGEGVDGILGTSKK